MQKIRIGIVGYGNLGRGIEVGLRDDMELVAIFTRRPANRLGRKATDNKVKIVPLEEINTYTDKIDVLLLCGGSKTDLPQQGPTLAKQFNTVDAYDTHAKMPEYWTSMNESSLAGSKTSIVATGWDPGLFSLSRVLFDTILPQATTYTFWGRGLSQGHSEAVRSIPGVKYAAQYTIPSEEMLAQVRAAQIPDYDSHSAHEREVYVVTETGADQAKIEETIITMPDYFAGYTTRVYFISEEEFLAHHTSKPHGGSVIRVGETSTGTRSVTELNLQLASNPEFTASVMLAYARACYRLSEEGSYGTKTVFDVPLSYLSERSSEELIKEYL